MFHKTTAIAAIALMSGGYALAQDPAPTTPPSTTPTPAPSPTPTDAPTAPTTPTDPAPVTEKNGLGVQVSALAKGEREGGIGKEVSALAHARNAAKAKSGDETDDVEAATEVAASAKVNARGARDGKAALATTRGSSAEVRAAAAEVRTAAKEARSNAAAVRDQARAIRDTVRSGRPGRGG